MLFMMTWIIRSFSRSRIILRIVFIFVSALRFIDSHLKDIALYMILILVICRLLLLSSSLGLLDVFLLDLSWFLSEIILGIGMIVEILIVVAHLMSC